MRVCPNCSHEIKDKKAEFCPRCGSKLPKELRVVKRSKLSIVAGALILIAPLTLALNRVLYFMNSIYLNLVSIMILLAVVTFVLVWIGRKWAQVIATVEVIVSMVLLMVRIESFIDLLSVPQLDYGFYYSQIAWFAVVFSIIAVGLVIIIRDAQKRSVAVKT
jgi:hypothetical protein